MNLAKPKILFVDDEPPILRLIDRIFYKSYETFCVSSGVEAIGLLKKQQFSVIVSDQRMPGISGLELMMIASQLQPQAVRIIMTGYIDENALKEAVLKGLIDLHITKPWNNEKLKSEIARAVEINFSRVQNLR